MTTLADGVLPEHAIVRWRHGYHAFFVKRVDGWLDIALRIVFDPSTPERNTSLYEKHVARVLSEHRGCSLVTGASSNNPESSAAPQASKAGMPQEVPMRITPGSFWLVIYEHRPAVIKIAADGSGFFACGQEECWPLREVKGWLRHIPVVSGEARIGRNTVKGATV